MNGLGRLLVVIGLALAAVGLVLAFADRLPLGRLLDRLPLGRLPGDVDIERGGFRFVFPWVTCLVVSAIVSLLVYLFRM